MTILSVQRLVALSLGLVAIGGCGKEKTQIICDPFSSLSGRASDRSGVAGSVYTFTSPQMQQFGSVLQLQRNGNRLNALMFLNGINALPTRFNAGFPVAGGGHLRTRDGAILTEYFALHLESVIVAAPDDPAGEYQFALLSDDGALLSVGDPGDARSLLISDDGTHAASLKCAPRTVHFDPETSAVPLKIDYFQGPRDQIALALFWRRIEGAVTPTTLADAACGQRGSDVFFDLGQSPPKPSPTWNSFLQRGWKPLRDVNYLLPEGIQSNPC